MVQSIYCAQGWWLAEQIISAAMWSLANASGTGVHDSEMYMTRRGTFRRICFSFGTCTAWSACGKLQTTARWYDLHVRAIAVQYQSGREWWLV